MHLFENFTQHCAGTARVVLDRFFLAPEQLKKNRVIRLLLQDF